MAMLISKLFSILYKRTSIIKRRKILRHIDDCGKYRRKRRSTVYPAGTAEIILPFGDEHLPKKLGLEKIRKNYSITDAMFEQAGLDMFKRKASYQKITLAVVILTLMTTTAFQCVDCIQRYLEWKVKTQITIDTVKQLNYPSITICSVNTLRKSVVGSNLLIHGIFAVMTIPDLNKAFEIAINSSKLCAKENETNTNDFQKLIDTAMAIKKVSEFNKYVHMAGVDSFLSVIKCWWNDNEFDCKNSFNNFIYEQYMCFTFNPNLALNAFTGGDSYGYGFNETDQRQKKVTSSRRNQGLRILLNAHQEEYCGLFSNWVGAGFLVLIHDFDRPQSFMNHAPLSLPPGCHTNVIMKPTVFDRRTEFMGTCKSSMDLFLIPLPTKQYFEEICYSQCILEMVWLKCKCLPTNMDSVQNLTAKHYGIPLEKVNLCVTLADIECFKKIGQDGVLYENTDKLCGCKTPCYDNKYEYSVSQLSIPPKHFISSLNLSSYFSSDYKWMKKNLVLASFSFENMNVQSVIETQMFTIRDVFIYIGGSCGLFLGWSFISMVGLFFHLILYIYQMSVKYFKKIKFYFTYHRKKVLKKNGITKRRPTIAELYF